MKIILHSEIRRCHLVLAVKAVFSLGDNQAATVYYGDLRFDVQRNKTSTTVRYAGSQAQKRPPRRAA